MTRSPWDIRDFAMPRYTSSSAVLVAASMLFASIATAGLVGGGGSKRLDCMAVFDSPSANKPPPPRLPRSVDCVDGDPACDGDGLRNGRCVFELGLCLNSTGLPDCVPELVNGVAVDHAVDDGDAKFDTDFQALQQRINILDLPADTALDDCTTPSSVTVVLRGPNRRSRMRKAKKKIKLVAEGSASGRSGTDRDRMKFMCRPEGGRVYEPRDLYTGTFDRIGQQVFSTSCALSACHDSESGQGGLVLLPNAAFSQIVGVTPNNLAAALDGLKRIKPGDSGGSYLYRKITSDLLDGYGPAMPLGRKALDPQLIEIIRLWIVGDPVLGPAPENGWVQGTD